MKKKLPLIFFVPLTVGLVALVIWSALLLSFPRPYQDTVRKTGVDPALLYAIMRTESGYREDAVSGAGAVGLMQLKPSTAEFICKKEGILFQEERLKEGAYNIALAAMYLRYLFSRFADADAALAAYNAGEGTVRSWLSDSRYSSDGKSLTKIPFPETDGYVKKIRKFRKIYEILY